MGKIRIGMASASILSVVAGLSGCLGGGGDSGSAKTGGGETFVVHSAAQIAQESDADYNNNVNGVITGATLKNWMTNWTANRPAGITGKLIVFQATVGPAGSQYVKPDGVNVFTYLSPSSEWIQTRSNGVIETTSMVPDGPTMDALMKKYDIDPSKDMIVAAMGTGSTTNAMAQGRIWYALRYWGVEKEHLALLNGGNQWLNGNGMTAADFQATASAAPNTGTFSVRNLPSDNTQLQATLEDMLNIVPDTDANQTGDGVMIWDARNLGQYSAGQKVESGEDMDPDTTGSQACSAAYCTPTNTGNYMWSFQNSGSRQGHPNGALQLQYTRLLDSTKGFGYKTKAALADYLAGKADASGIGFVDGQYNAVGSGKAYQEGDTIYTYCETTFRAMITGVAAGVILGKPTRFYDGAMIEWNSLSYSQDKNGSLLMPAESPWRSDVLSYFRSATSNTLVNTRNIVGPYAGSAKAVVNADRSYKSGIVIPTSASGGSMPGNPCGG